jgi:hypothetical protein
MLKHDKPPDKPNQSHKAAVPPLSAKRLAHEVGIDVRTLRHVLRAKYRHDGKDHAEPWLWTTQKEIEAVRRYVTRVLGRQVDGGSQ